MKTKLFDSLRSAFPRFLLGAIGIWCILGPILLLNASGAAGLGLTAVLVVLLVLCYAVVIVIGLRAKWDALKDLVSETTFAMCFIIIGLLTNEITGVFIAIKHKLVIVYAFVGFFIAELIKTKGFSNTLVGSQRKQSSENERSKEDSSRGLADQNDELVKEKAALTRRLAENQTTLAQYEKEQARWVSVLGENQQLQEKISTLRNRLARSESQLEQSTVRIQEVVGLSTTLQCELAALKQQLVEREGAIESLQRMAQHAAKLESDNQGILFENQRLQEELTSHRVQLTTSEARLQELAGRNQEISDRYERLETEVADLSRRLKDSQSKDRGLETARQQLANVASREMLYKEQQQQLEKRIVDLERELSEEKNQFPLRDDTLQRLRETERVSQELTEENRRLWETVSDWQERLAAGEESRRQVNILSHQIHELQIENTRLIHEKRRAQEEFVPGGKPIAVSRLVSDFNGPTVIRSTANTGADLSLDRRSLSAPKAHERMPSEVAIAVTNRGDQPPHLNSGDSAVGIHLEKKEEENWIDWTSIKRQWRFGAVAATVIVIAGAVLAGVLGTEFSRPKPVAVALETHSQDFTAEAVSGPLEKPAAETRFQENIVEPVSKPQRKPAPRLQGTFQTVRATQVYDGPSENSAWIADISAGMKLNVVDSTFGWLEIRSMHGRPRGFVRQEAAVSIARN